MITIASAHATRLALALASGLLLIYIGARRQPVSIPAKLRHNVLIPVGVLLLALALWGVSSYFIGSRNQQTLDITVLTPEQEIVDIEKSLFDALKRQDAEALSKLLADDFEFREAGNDPISKANFVKAATSVDGPILSVDSNNMRAQSYGEIAVLSGSQKYVVRLKNGKEVRGEGVFTDVFARREGRWLLVFAHNVEMSAKQAGATN